MDQTARNLSRLLEMPGMTITPAGTAYGSALFKCGDNSFDASCLDAEAGIYEALIYFRTMHLAKDLSGTP